MWSKDTHPPQCSGYTRPVRIGIYGGSFNPPHVGHGMVAAWLRWVDLVDEVWMVPTYDHAFGKNLAPFELRCRMCAALGELVGPWVRVETIEQDLPAPSYTIDTLRALKARRPTDTFRLVVGSDVLLETHRWKDWSGISDDFAPIVVGRTDYAAIEGRPSFPRVSSTEVRDRIAAGQPVDHLVPPSLLALLPHGVYEPDR